MASDPEVSVAPTGDAKKSALPADDQRPPSIEYVENPDLEPTPKVAISTMLAVFFMGLTYVPAIATGFIMPTQILQQIGMALGDTENIAWIPGSWSIGSAVAFSIAGGLSDVFGRRYVLLSGQAIVLVGGIICAVSQTTLHIVAGTTLVGFGAGTIMVAYPGISELLPNKYRGIGLAWTEFCITIPWGSLAGLIATHLYLKASWRWCYYITIIYAAICLRTRWQQVKELDYIGLLLFATGLTVFLIGVTFLGATHRSMTLVATTISIGACIFIAAFVYDFTVPKKPLFPIKIFRMYREFTVYLVVLFVSGMIWQGVVTLGNQGTLFMFTNDIIEIGVISVPASMSGIIGGWIMPSLVHKLKHIRYQFVFALLMQTAFTASYAAVIPNNKTGWTLLPMFGQSCFTWVTVLSYVSSGLLVPQEELGVSAGLMGTFRSAGGSLGNAMFSTILTSIVNRDLGNNIAGAAIGAGYSPKDLPTLIPAVIQNAVGVPFAMAKVPNVTEPVLQATAAAFKNTYAKAFRTVFYSTIPLGVLAIIAACFIRDPSHLLNNHVAVQQEKEVVGKKKDIEMEPKIID
ncbi:related to potential drug facilitator PEP5 [Fusarium fujikuroi IMI 58289]|uniref:Related to potential drug facilitator PEP5 n=1 Tax=Gibberella fujikuroi (strain CBS 195.34 / IMI 58289 / NRRL A-6831) TaxID=1279085 RepID=S0ELD9_GIBF5|nr:PEP5-like protein [Fusarium fujikuroi IMI 58289]KLO97103.1 putative drug facilitator PEP5 [Fusarium fujikuroi]KLO99953.1 putative drug facilitator PEP5 [Fusarium fujikuroi]CCT75616.1 related to potential drug facilitator PEP5 [Fusarium fujikuroi IMI 58289]